MIRHLLAACLAVLVAQPAAAQLRQSHCIALADATPGIQYLHKASFGAPLEDFAVRLNYVAHATFVLETPEGATAATDYTGFLGSADFVPDVVTMNIAHSTHWTPNPDPRIPHVLRGWDVAGAARDHYLTVADMLVRNVPTDIRGGMDGRREDGNSIFIFEVGGLCIGHLGHLHHEPSEDQYAAIGRLDVVMAPVDGGFTLPQETLVRMLTRMRSSLVIPMHWFGGHTLDRFLTRMEADFAIERTGDSFTEVSLRTLPDRPTVRVLRPRYLE
ncbi:MBL fold metallo-hydrolase [Rhodovulum sp. YNF3179]|uniref:MBL fold metallo-hydrolase n=1 Tax=Rhodovulum sp. YNF3179 TaxID=3425127 RepID=UPI003D334A5A